MQTQQHAPARTRRRMLRTAQLAIAGAALALRRAAAVVTTTTTHRTRRRRA